MPEPSFLLKIVTPNELFLKESAVSVTAPGTLGYLCILAHHAPLVTTLEKGNLSFRNEAGQTQTFQIEGGFLEVLNNQVLVLTDKIQT